MEDLNQMKYLECCIKESLRIYPSVPAILRYITEEIDIGIYKTKYFFYFLIIYILLTVVHTTTTVCLFENNA